MHRHIIWKINYCLPASPCDIKSCILNYLHRVAFLHKSPQLAKVSVVIGRQKAQNIRSDMVSDITNGVVECFLILGQFHKAANVNKLRMTPTILMKMEAKMATGTWLAGKAKFSLNSAVSFAMFHNRYFTFSLKTCSNLHTRVQRRAFFGNGKACILMTRHPD